MPDRDGRADIIPDDDSPALRGVALGFSGRLMAVFASAFGLMLLTDLARQTGLVDSLTRSSIRFLIWSVAVGFLIGIAHKSSIPRPAFFAMIVFSICTLLGFGLRITTEIPRLDQAIFIGNHGTFSRILPKILNAGWFVGLCYLFHVLLLSFDRQTKRLAAAKACFQREIEERKRIEITLCASEQQFREIFDSEPECVKLVDKSGNVLDMNPAGLEMVEAESLDQVRGLSILPMIVEEDRERVVAACEAAFRGERQVLEYEFDGFRGTRRRVEEHIAPMRNSIGEVESLIGVTRDITDRVLAESQIRALAKQNESIAELGRLALSEATLTQLMDAAVAMLRDVLHADFAKAMELRNAGKSLHICASVGWDDSVQKDYAIPVSEESQAGTTLRCSEPVVVFDMKSDDRFSLTPALRRHAVRSGMTVVIDGHDGHDGPYGVLGVHTRHLREFSENDINFLKSTANILSNAVERSRADASLRQTQFSLDRAADGVFWIDSDAGLVYVNDSACRSLEYTREELLGLTIADIDPGYPLDDWTSRWGSYRGSSSETFESIHRTKTGRDFPVDVSVYYMKFNDREFHCAFVRDVTVRKEMEEQLRRHRDEVAHVQRISTMGELATGLAHELAQPLTTIANYSSICLKRLDDDAVNRSVNEKVLEFLQVIEDESRRAGEIIHRLRRFVNKDDSESAGFDFNASVRDAASLVTRDLSAAGVTLQMNLADVPLLCHGDAVQVEQVILNLMRNAIESMCDCDRGPRDLIVTTSRANDLFMQCDICDTGQGIPTSDRERIFDSFVTTKKNGMGLGLAISRSIVANHGGTLSVVPDGDLGATLRMELPIATQPAAAATAN